MPDDILPPDSTLFPDDATAAARTAAALRAREQLSGNNRDSSRPNYKVDINEDAASSLDRGLDEALKEEGAPPATGTVVAKAPGVPENPAAPKKPAEPKSPAQIEEERAAENAALHEEGATSLDKLLEAAQENPEAPAPKTEDEPPAQERTGEFSEHQLPANASQKSKDNFERLKQAAAERVTAAETKAAELAAKLEAQEAALKEAQAKAGVLTPELETELKELREHRALFDTERDPAFLQKYDSRQAQHYQTIYDRLKLHNYPDDQIAELKALPKAERDGVIDRLVGLLEKPEERRPFESAMLKIQTIEDERVSELQNTKAKAAEILKAKRTDPVAQTAARIDAVANKVKPNVNPKSLPWLFPKEIKPDTPPELKKQLEAHNKFAGDMQEMLRAAIVDDSVETRATAAISVPLAQYYFRELNVAKAALAAANEKLAKITRAGATSRLAERASVKSDSPKKLDLDGDRNETIDNLFKEAQHEESRGNLR